MKIIVNTVDDEEICLDKISELSLIQSADAVCDSLYIYLKPQQEIAEIVTVKAYEKGKLIFNGICDCQKTTENKDGFEIYIYARSTAEMLVDNEAEPFTYAVPTARQLCFHYANSFGFKCDLPNIESQEKYEVTLGTSCYGAINQFVYFCTGSNIVVTPENEIKLLDYSDNVKSVNSYNVLSAKATINRSAPLSMINFKKSLNSNGYQLHTKAQISDELKINRVDYINLTSFADWQRDYTILQKLKKSYNSYKLLEIVVSGYADEDLFQRFKYNSKNASYDDYALVEKRYICDKNGKRTRLTLRKIIDVKEITYVD